MAAPTPAVLSRPEVAREAVVEAREVDLNDHVAVIRSQARLAHTVEMLLHLLAERAA